MDASKAKKEAPEDKAAVGVGWLCHFCLTVSLSAVVAKPESIVKPFQGPAAAGG
jgi:hypothetical protein